MTFRLVDRWEADPAFNRTRRNWNSLPSAVWSCKEWLLIAPEGIEITHQTAYFLSPYPFNRTRRNWNLNIIVLVIVAYVAFNRTRRNWNLNHNRQNRCSNTLLIAPEGIEITQPWNPAPSASFLLIAPEGIEICNSLLHIVLRAFLLIAPEGIEISILWKFLQLHTAFNRTRRNWNKKWICNNCEHFTLLIAPEGIEIISK